MTEYIFNLIVFLALSSFGVISSNGVDNDRDALQEYCLMEVFHPTCLKNEVIVINRAIYGRRRVGKCIKDTEAAMSSDPRYMGCSADVLDILNVKCSGRKQCEIRIPEVDLEHTEPCLPGLKMYLEVSFTCVEVIEEDRSCTVALTPSPLHIAKPSGSSSTVASFQPSNGQLCGTTTHPWVLEAPAGQRIRISLVDFTPTAGEDSGNNDGHVMSRISGGCDNQQQEHAYGFIIDTSAAVVSMRNVSICAAVGSKRLVPVHLSSTNAVRLQLVSNEQQLLTMGQQKSILIKIEAVGCTNLVPPEDAWIKREDDLIVIGCYTSRQTWQLRCDDGRWIGVVSNCTQPHLNAAPPDISEERIEVDRYEVATLVAIGFICLAICLTIVCCGMVCLQRFYARRLQKANLVNYNGVLVHH